jgi:ABC-type dipeptide/oligopeptide/nickel transport system permease component
MLSRVVEGARVSLAVSIAVVAIAGVVGLIEALVAGYRGGRLDAFLMRTTDASLAFPVLLLAIVVVGVYGASTTIVIIILAIAFWPSYARVLRSEVLHLKTMDYVTMAKTMGGSSRWVVRRHIVPNAMGPIIIAVGANPPATGWPLSGATTNHATSVGKIAPKIVAATISFAPCSRPSAAASKTPHTPPQKASDQSCGMPNGAVAAIG